MCMQGPRIASEIHKRGDDRMTKRNRPTSFRLVKVSKKLYNKLCKDCDNLERVIRDVPYAYYISVRDK